MTPSPDPQPVREPVTKAGDDLLNDLIQSHEGVSYTVIEAVRDAIPLIEEEAAKGAFLLGAETHQEAIDALRALRAQPVKEAGLREAVEGLIAEYADDDTPSWDDGVPHLVRTAVVADLRAALAAPSRPPERAESVTYTNLGPTTTTPATPAAAPALDAREVAAAMHESGICAGWQPDDPMDHERDHLEDAEAFLRCLTPRQEDREGAGS